MELQWAPAPMVRETMGDAAVALLRAGIAGMVRMQPGTRAQGAGMGLSLQADAGLARVLEGNLHNIFGIFLSL